MSDKQLPPSMATPIGKTKVEPKPVPETPAQPPQPMADAQPMFDAQPELAIQPVQSIPSLEAAAPAAPIPSVLPGRPDVPPTTLKELLTLVDAGWTVFWAATLRFPGERMDERVTEEGWTHKQMLAHISAWHDSTHDRLGKLILTGKPGTHTPEADVGQLNARAARVAIGKTAGEVVKDMQATFNRLRRQLQRLTEAQLAAGDGWAAQIVAGNTYDHYDEHMADIYVPEPVEGQNGNR